MSEADLLNNLVRLLCGSDKAPFPKDVQRRVYTDVMALCSSAEADLQKLDREDLPTQPVEGSGTGGRSIRQMAKALVGKLKGIMLEDPRPERVADHSLTWGATLATLIQIAAQLPMN